MKFGITLNLTHTLNLTLDMRECSPQRNGDRVLSRGSGNPAAFVLVLKRQECRFHVCWLQSDKSVASTLLSLQMNRQWLGNCPETSHESYESLSKIKIRIKSKGRALRKFQPSTNNQQPPALITPNPDLRRGGRVGRCGDRGCRRQSVCEFANRRGRGRLLFLPTR